MDMKIVRFLPLPVLLAVALLAAGCGGGGGSQGVPSDDVALVGSVPITKQQYEDLLTAAQSQYKARKQAFPKVGTTDYKSLSDRAVAYLVQQTELEQKAKQLGITSAAIDSGVQKQIDKIKKVQFHNNKKLYEDQLKAAGLTEAQLRLDLHGQVLAQDIYNKVTSKVKVANSKIKDFYTANKAQYTTDESREVRHILVSSKAKAQNIRTQLVNGAAFGTLAKKYSTDTSSAKQGGKLCVAHGTGTSPSGCIQTVPPFDKAAFSLKTNEISQPVHSTYGWHIIQPVGPIKPGNVETLKSVQASIKANLLSTEKTAAMQTWVNNLKKEYLHKVVYQTGYAPASTATTGATTTG
jgi:foldase protein PrsA